MERTACAAAIFPGVEEDDESSSASLRRENARLSELVSRREAELASLQTRRDELEQQLVEANQQKEGLASQLAEWERMNRVCKARHALLEKQASRLLRLYVVMSRLYDAMDRDQVLVALQEIVTHIIGSEEMALFRLDECSGQLWAVMSLGIDPVRLHALRAEQGPIGQAAASRRLFVSNSPPRIHGEQTADELSACIPLCLDGKVYGVLALFRLLPQKKSFDEVDHELFTLLGSQVARALYRAELYGRHRKVGAP